MTELRKQYLSTNKARKSKGGEVASVYTIGIQMANINLDRGVVLGSNKPIGGRAVKSYPKPFAH